MKKKKLKIAQIKGLALKKSNKKPAIKSLECYGC